MPISFNNVDKVYHGTTPIKKVYRGSAVEWEEPVNYFRIVNENAGSNTITLTKNGTPTNNITLDYSTNNGSTWTTWSSANGNLSVNLAQGDELLFKGDNATFSTGENDYFTFGATENISAAGNIMTLVYSTGASTTIPCAYCFNSLFDSCTTLTSIMDLLMPATTLTDYCYLATFWKCSGITSLPSGLLPATTLATGCYRSLFAWCEGITSIPSGFLPATTLATHCYYSMFSTCTSLVTVPSNLLPAATLSEWCYALLFQSCTSLTSVPSNLLPATNLANQCYNGFFKNCTSLTTGPKLSTTNLVGSCYNLFFYNCSSLSSIDVDFKDWNGGAYTNKWVYGVPTTGTFKRPFELAPVKNTKNDDFGYFIPAGWTIQSYSFDGLRIINKTSSANTFKITKTGTPNTVTLEYSLDKGTTKTTWSSSSGNLSVNIPANGMLVIRNTSTTTTNFSTGSSNFYTLSCTGNFAAAGDVSYLINKNGNVTDMSSNAWVFYGLFSHVSTLIDTSDLVFPATKLTTRAYGAMFHSCSALTKAPRFLPATSFGQYSYGNMFYGTGIHVGPVIYATSMSASNQMWSMFSYSHSLNKVATYITSWNTSNSSSWLDGVSSSGSFYDMGKANPSTGTAGRPSGWTRYTAAPDAYWGSY